MWSACALCRLVALVSALLMVLSGGVVSVTGATSPPANLTIGLVVPLTGPYAIQYAAVVYLAHRGIDAINASPSILPHTQLQLAVRDSASDQAATIAATISLVLPEAQGGAGAVAIIGELFSSLSEVEALATKPYVVPMISPYASSTDFPLQHATHFPWFVGTYPNNVVEAVMLASFVASQGWQKVALLFTTDSYASSGATATASYLATLGLDVLVSVSFVQNQQDLSFEMARIASTNARIIIFWGIEPDWQTVVKAGAAMNPPMFGGEGYQWIVSEGTATPFANLDENGVVIPSITELMVGVVGVQLFYDTSSAAYADMVQSYKTGTTVYDSLVSLESLSSVDPESIGPVPSCTWDSVRLLGAALHDLIEVQQLDPRNITNRPQLFQDLTKVSFEGASGTLILDANGIRTTGFSMQNFQRSSNGAASFVNLGPVTNLTFTPLTGTSIVWMGTQGRVPDVPVRTNLRLSSSATTALQALAALLIGCILVVMVAIALLRDAAVFKASSPIFLELMCAGTVLLCASIFPRTLESNFSQEQRNSACVTDLWLGNIGYTLIVGALLVKEYRIHKIFLMKSFSPQQKPLLDVHLLLGLAGLVALEVVLLLSLQFGVGIHSALFSANSTQNYWHCTSDSDTNLVSVFLPATITTRFALLVFTVYCVYQIRDVPSAFNETRQITITAYNLLFLSILLPAIDASMERGRDAAMIAYSVCVLVICTLTIVIMLANKFAAIASAGTSDINKTEFTCTAGDSSATSPKNTSRVGGVKSSAGSPIGVHSSVARGTIGHRNSLPMPITRAPSQTTPAMIGQYSSASASAAPPHAAAIELSQLVIDVRGGGVNGAVTPLSLTASVTASSSRPSWPRGIQLHLAPSLASDVAIFLRHKPAIMEYISQQGLLHENK